MDAQETSTDISKCIDPLRSLNLLVFAQLGEEKSLAAEVLRANRIISRKKKKKKEEVGAFLRGSVLFLLSKLHLQLQMRVRLKKPAPLTQLLPHH